MRKPRKLSPLNIFKRLLTPPHNDFHYIDFLNSSQILIRPLEREYRTTVNRSTYKSEILIAVRDLEVRMKKELNLFLYRTAKMAIAGLDLPKKSGESYLQVSRNRVAGGMYVLFKEEPKIFSTYKPIVDKYEILLYTSYAAFVDTKETYLVVE